MFSIFVLIVALFMLCAKEAIAIDDPASQVELGILHGEHEGGNILHFLFVFESS